MPVMLLNVSVRVATLDVANVRPDALAAPAAANKAATSRVRFIS
jgi:hypothetical protein